MSYVLNKKVADCTEEEREYKREYSRYIKKRRIERIGQDTYHNYNSEYGKQYYQLHKEKLQTLARERKRALGASNNGRGRPSTLGICV